MAKCNSCGADIEWVKTAKGKNLPIDKKPVWVQTANGPIECFRTHFETCPHADQHRKRAAQQPAAADTNQSNDPTLPFG